MSLVIERPDELQNIAGIKKWTIIFGRRKTGKSFLVENNVKYDAYYFVNRDRTILSKEDGRGLNYEAFMAILKKELEDDKTIVIDEFHRLGESFMDYIHASQKTGRLILLTSTLFMARRLLSGKSPLLGLFHEVQIPLISLKETLRALRKFNLKKDQLLELAVFFREPIAIDYFDQKESARMIISKILIGAINSIPALLGEIFLEEERRLSSIYEGIIRAVADGKVNSGEIADFLFSSGLLKKNDPSLVQPYMNILLKLGILKRLRVYPKNRFVYKIDSPLIRLFFYADQKYGISERNVSIEEAKRIVDEAVPRIIEDTVREAFAQKYGLEESVLQSADYEVDGCLLRFDKPSVLLEVKWVKDLKESDIRKIEKKLSIYERKERLLFVKDKNGFYSRHIKIYDVDEL